MRDPFTNGFFLSHPIASVTSSSSFTPSLLYADHAETAPLPLALRGSTRKTTNPSAASDCSNILPPFQASETVGVWGPPYVVSQTGWDSAEAGSRPGGRINSPSRRKPSRAGIFTSSRGPNSYSSCRRDAPESIVRAGVPSARESAILGGFRTSDHV